jgi:hypothetical protein
MNEEKSIGDAVSVFDSSDKVENTDNIDCQDLCGNIKLPITIPYNIFYQQIFVSDLVLSFLLFVVFYCYL